MIKTPVLLIQKINGFAVASISIYLSRYDQPASIRSSSFVVPCHTSFAETKYPSTVDEKLNSEVGTYVWMQHQCSDICIPCLYGFSFFDYRYISYYIYCLIVFVLTMLLVYRLSMSHRNLSTSAFGATLASLFILINVRF